MRETGSPHETAAREFERMQKVEAFIRHELSGETRVSVPMDPRCEVAVVVPAYSERDNLFLRTLRSLARQEGVTADQFEAIVVVNNPPSEPARQPGESDIDHERKLELYRVGRRENRQALAMLRYLGGTGAIPDWATEEERAALEEIRAAGVRAYAIDKSTHGRTFPPEHANVGGSRCRGVAEAVARFAHDRGRDGIIGQTDGDTRVDVHYIAELIKAFENPKVVGLAGRLEFDRDASTDALFSELSSRAELMTRYGWVMEGLKQGTAPPDQRQKVMFSGANMASRAFAAALVGGVPKIAGGEDPAFGLRLADIGEVIEARDVVTHPLDRLSARTSVEAGHGQKRLRMLDASRTGDLLVENPEVAFQFRRMMDELNRLHREGRMGVDDLRGALTVDGTLLLGEDDLRFFSDTLRSAPGSRLTEVAHATPRLREIRVAINNRLETIFPKLPIEEASARVLHEALKEPVILVRYQENLDVMVREETEAVQGRERLVRGFAEVLRETEPAAFAPDAAFAVLREHAPRLGIAAVDVERASRDPEVVHLVELYGDYPSPDAALARAKEIFPERFSRPEEDPDHLLQLKLSALSRALE